MFGDGGNDQFESAGDSGATDSLHGGSGTDTASLIAGDRDNDDVNPTSDIENWT